MPLIPVVQNCIDGQQNSNNGGTMNVVFNITTVNMPSMGALLR